jgi:hypothetical protein
MANGWFSREEFLLRLATNFTGDEECGHSFVFKQPQTPEEESAVQLHPSVLAVVDLPNQKELA